MVYIRKIWTWLARGARKPSPIWRGRKPSARIIACARMIRPSVHNRRSLGKPFSALRNRSPLRLCVRFTPKPRSDFSDGLYPKNLDVVGARSAQAFANLARTASVRADHRLRTDDEAIRAQSTILG
jgi:hypothetical protein